MSYTVFCSGADQKTKGLIQVQPKNNNSSNSDFQVSQTQVHTFSQ